MKPWKTSNNRQSPANGLLLSANFDALFDAGLVTLMRAGR
jgi:HNH endonuclease